jgi:type VI secretion system protein ImpA
MAILDLDVYLKPISDAEPCGEALDYDLSFLELDMAARGKPAQELGSSVVAAEPPNWNEVDRLAGELSSQTKDLRIAVLAARAALNLEGLTGFRRGLEALAIYIETYWEELHPRPDDEEEADDQTVRLNALANLCDPEGLLSELRRVPVAQSRVFGNFAFDVYQEAQRSAAGETPSSGSDIINIESSFRDTPAELLETWSTELRGALEQITRIDKGVRTHVDAVQAVRFDPLSELLQQMLHVVDEHRPEAAEAGSEATGTEGAAQPGARAPAGEIRDRNDIVSMLDRICRWYRVNEPASPVPALLERTKRLVAKDFMALLVELAPEGAAQFRALAGLTAEGAPHGS